MHPSSRLAWFGYGCLAISGLLSVWHGVTSSTYGGKRAGTPVRLGYRVSLVSVGMFLVVVGVLLGLGLVQ